jgi:hypothetical protein
MSMNSLHLKSENALPSRWATYTVSSTSMWASVPRGEAVDPRQLHMDDCQVVYECSSYKPRI